MQAAADYVARHPGCCKLDVALGAVQNRPGSRDMGALYDPINRAIRAGLIVTRRGSRRDRYYLYTPEAAADRDRTIAETYGVTG